MPVLALGAVSRSVQALRRAASVPLARTARAPGSGRRPPKSINLSRCDFADSGASELGTTVPEQPSTRATVQAMVMSPTRNSITCRTQSALRIRTVIPASCGAKLRQRGSAVAGVQCCTVRPIVFTKSISIARSFGARSRPNRCPGTRVGRSGSRSASRSGSVPSCRS